MSEQPISVERRLDITLRNLDAEIQKLTEEQKAQLTAAKGWPILILVAHLRGMERAEEEILGHTVPGLANAYDRVVKAGDPAIDAIFRTFKACYQRGDDGVLHDAYPEALA